MAPGIRGNLVSVAKTHQRSVPSFHLCVHRTEDLCHYLCSFFAIERRAWVALRHEFRVIGAVARARYDQPAGTQDAPRLGQSEPRIVQVVEHPQKHDGVEAAICNGQAGSIGSDDRTVQASGELARGFIDAEPPHSPANRRCESTDAASYVQDPTYLLAHQSLDHRAVHVLLPAHLE
jgi:hypothetical protein